MLLLLPGPEDIGGRNRMENIHAPDINLIAHCVSHSMLLEVVNMFKPTDDQKAPSAKK